MHDKGQMSPSSRAQPPEISLSCGHIFTHSHHLIFPLYPLTISINGNLIKIGGDLPVFLPGFPRFVPGPCWVRIGGDHPFINFIRPPPPLLVLLPPECRASEVEAMLQVSAPNSDSDEEQLRDPEKDKNRKSGNCSRSPTFSIPF